MGHGGKPDPEIERTPFQVPVPPRENTPTYWKAGAHGLYLRPYFEKRSPIRSWPDDNAVSSRDIDNYLYGAVVLGIGGLMCRKLPLGKPLMYTSLIAAPIHMYGTSKNKNNRSKAAITILTPLVMGALFRSQWIASGSMKPLTCMILSASEVVFNTSSRISWWWHYRNVQV